MDWTIHFIAFGECRTPLGNWTSGSPHISRLPIKAVHSSIQFLRSNCSPEMQHINSFVRVCYFEWWGQWKASSRSLSCWSEKMQCGSWELWGAPFVFADQASDPVQGLVIEDAPSGLIAGRRAGAMTLAVCTSHSREGILGSNCNPDYIVKDLTEWDPRDPPCAER